MTPRTSRIMVRAALLLTLPAAAFGCPWEPTGCPASSQSRLVDLDGGFLGLAQTDSGVPLGNHLAQEQCNVICGFGQDCVSATQQNGEPAVVCLATSQCH